MHALKFTGFIKNDLILSLEQTNSRFWTREEKKILVDDSDMKVKKRTNKFNQSRH